MIRIENISKEFTTQKEAFSAVKNVSIHIKKGDIFGIIGLSGAGKSTLVRCINRLEEPSNGHIYIDGQDITACTDTQLVK